MFYAIGWSALGFVLGGCVGVFAMALVASGQRDAKVAMLAGSNKRLLGDRATAAVRIVELERDVAVAEKDRDHWRTESMKVVDVFVGAPWEEKD